jgi:hypothetical protein
MSKINWEIVDRDTFADYKTATAEEIARAYVAENMADKPNQNKIVSLYELGQGRYSEHLNNRDNREALFSARVNDIARLWPKAGN